MFIAILLTAAAPVTPVYLECSLTRVEAAPLGVDLTLDEANQRATISLDTGRVVVRPAVFAPDRVQVPDDEMTWIVSRTDLTLHRRTSFTPAAEPGEAGTCKIKPTPGKRAF